MDTSEPISKTKEERKNVSFGKKLLPMVDKFCELYGMNRSELIRIALIEFLLNHDFKPSE